MRITPSKLLFQFEKQQTKGKVPYSGQSGSSTTLPAFQHTDTCI